MITSPRNFSSGAFILQFCNEFKFNLLIFSSKLNFRNGY